jgi:hypothetical protein
MESKSLLDPSFRYTPRFATNLKDTFRRIRRQLRDAGAKAAADGDKATVVPFERTKAQRSG